MPQDITSIDPNWAWSPFEPSSEQPWNRRLAAHLFRRSGFSASSQELTEAANSDPGAVVRTMVSEAAKAASIDDATDKLAQAMLATGDAKNLAAWWLHRMLTTKTPLLEKLSLFWHGHFATSAAKVTDAELMFDQNRLIRQHAVGDFGAMVHEISHDPAMLIWLDSATNRKAHPNENFAREIMELFCLGEGNYSETDIRELARCFTGWEIKRDKFRFNRFQHDTAEKTVLGQTGKFGGEDGVRVVLEQKSAPQFIVRKLINFFLFDEPQASEALIEPLATLFRESDLNVQPVIERLLSSNLFFSEWSIARKVRSPVELGVGLLRSLDASCNVRLLARMLDEIGQSVFYPPNVKGWDGGRTWINTSTLLSRANLVGELLRNENTRFAGGNLESLLKKSSIDAPEELTAWLDELLMAVPTSMSVKERLVDLAENGQGDASRRSAETIHALSTVPEFHLA